MEKNRLSVKILAAVVASIMLVLGLSACSSSKKKGGTLDSLKASEIECVMGVNTDDWYHNLYVNSAKGLKKLVTVSDLNLPEDLMNNTYQPLGLFFRNDGKYVSAIEHPELFDESKKTFFYTHGMGGNGGWYMADEYVELGYNVLCFFWGAFSAEDGDAFSALCDKVWIYDGNSRYKVERDGNWIDGRDIEYSVVEIYAAYYLDTLLAHPNYDKEIVVAGHSYGGMNTVGLLSYLTTAFRSGIMPARCLPDRALLCDPFLVCGDPELHIRWLSDLENGEYGGVTYWAYETLLAARTLGIPVTFFRTSVAIEMPALFGYPDMDSAQEVLDSMKGATLYVNSVVNGVLPLEEAHIYGYYYPGSMTYTAYDTVKKDELSFGLFNPAYSDYGRVGEVYNVNCNKTPYDTSDDTVTLKYGGKTKIYGYVFSDENENGLLDERLAKRICGAHVTIKDAEGNVVLDEDTALAGYFEVKVDPGEYTVSVTMPKGYKEAENKTVTVKDGDYFAEVLMPATMK